MWPGPLLPISQTTAWVSSPAERTVRGRPTSLLNEATLATVRSCRPRTAAVRSLVHVFPVEPVTAMTVAVLPSRSSRARS